MTTAEQKARDMLERMEVPRAQEYTAGELVELANLIQAAGEFLAYPRAPYAQAAEALRQCATASVWELLTDDLLQTMKAAGDGESRFWAVVRHQAGPFIVQWSPYGFWDAEEHDLVPYSEVTHIMPLTVPEAP